MTWVNTKLAFLVGVALLLAGVATTISSLPAKRADDTHTAVGVEAFKNHLTNDAPVRLLRFSETDAKTGVERRFLAAVDGDDFFLREYETDEDTNALISTNNWIQNGRLRGKFWGRYRDLCWSINGPYLTKTSAADAVVNPCRLDVKAARNKIDWVLNLGISPVLVKRGSVVWNNTNTTRFTAELVNGVRLRRLGDGVTLTNEWGRIIVKNGRVLRMECAGVTDYEYADSSSVPFGMPTTIRVGSGWLGYQREFRVEGLVYGHLDDPQSGFNPESKYTAPDLPEIVWIANGQRKPVQPAGRSLSVPPNN